MTNEIEAAPSVPPVPSSSSWCCVKIFKYLKNRNRVSPGRIESAECEFFVVGPGRVLRVLAPTPQGRLSYASRKNERPDSMEENFVSRWASRPHPSGNCRCSFRRSSKNLGTSDLDEDEDSDNRRSVEVENVEAPSTIGEVLTSPSRESAGSDEIGMKSCKNGALREKIVRDLEEYIDKLLGEVLTDTMRFLEGADECTKKSATNDRGCLNRAFVSSEDDPDSLELPRDELPRGWSRKSLPRTDYEPSTIVAASANEADPRIETFEASSIDEEGPGGRSNGSCESTRKNRFRTFARRFLGRRKDDDDDDDGKKERSRNASNSSPIVDIDIGLDSMRKKSESAWSSVGESRRIYRKPTLVFLHGFGSSADAFENQLEYFSNLGYPCVAPELLGHGMSSAPNRSRDYRFEKLLKDLETVLAHYAFRPGTKCVLVAHNYGCSFATALARKYKSHVHQLVLISGGGPTPLAPPSTEGPGHCCLRAALAPLLMCGLGRDVLYSARGRQHPYCGPETSEPRPSHMRHVLNGMIWPEGDYVFHRGITTPTLLVHGLRDDKVSLVQECQMERTIIKAFLDAIPTAGHTPMVDSPEQVNHMIHCFVDLWKRKKR